MLSKYLSVLAIGSRRNDPIDAIREMFDASFYRESTSEPIGSDDDLVRHYLDVGWKNGLDPARWFSTNGYLSANPDVAESGMNPFLHYALYGRAEGRASVPPEKDATYRLNWTAPNKSSASDAVAPWFDQTFYRAGFRRGEVPDDLIEHYLSEGWREGRDPAPWFSTRHYLATNEDVAEADVNPFVHYCSTGRFERRRLTPLGHPAQGLYAAHESALSRGPFFEEIDPAIGVGGEPAAMVLSYYLPQFHRHPVNDRHWGNGFTEWRNLPRALPRFEGHLQPRLPRDLGFYDLSHKAPLKRQIKLAQDAGIHGFCFYHYWFDGARVLDEPVEGFLDDPSLEFPFCLMWANENWTRTWDGAETDVLLAQSYHPDHDEALVADFARHMADPRYIRLGGRPLLFLYRPGHVPNAKDTIARWREIFGENHELDPLIFMAQGFGDTDPREYGLDGAIEFPPHKLLNGLDPINDSLAWIDDRYRGHVYDYEAVVERSVVEPAPDYPLIKTAVPSWDNEARRPGRGMVLHGASPAKFEAWMRQLVDHARRHPVFDHPIVCVNAWNEWAEGATLEPDVHHGGAYLNALARAAFGRSGAVRGPKVRVLLVGHDAERNGAQKLLLNIARVLTAEMGLQVNFLLLRDGPLRSEYEAIGEVFLADPLTSEEELRLHLARLHLGGVNCALTNTVVAGLLSPQLKSAGMRVVSLIHELPGIILEKDLGDAARLVAEHADQVVFPACIVKERFEEVAGPISNSAAISPQGIYSTKSETDDLARGATRAELGADAAHRVVLGVGYGDLRKGLDRFVAVALASCRADPSLIFVWVGSVAPEMKIWIEPEIAASGMADRIRILGHQEDVGRFYAAADLFYLASREDPFPSVVLEALAWGLPVVGHRGCGGCDSLIERHGVLVDGAISEAATAAIIDALDVTPKMRDEQSMARMQEAETSFDFVTYVFDLLQRLVPDLPSVSAAILSYNYERYMPQRVTSVLAQTHPLREVLLLDDASSDDSVTIACDVAATAQRKMNVVVNEKNTGSVFRQWRRAAEMAKAEYIWLAEADDIADPELLATLLPEMTRSCAIMGFCDSTRVNTRGQVISDSYMTHLDDIEGVDFSSAFDMDAESFLRSCLAIKNVMLNASAVVFHRDTLLDAFETLGDELYSYRIAGDWRLYVEMCLKGSGKVCYVPQSLNAHRYHEDSVTRSTDVKRHLDEIMRVQSTVRNLISLEAKVIRQQHRHFENCRDYLGAQ
ncbi:glycoside hydrolase family 99-like domain-containing protein [Maritalea mobilis]|uniref:glycoside hydrolase family 99-like domain-containing protein n=1 Tax=Maritalea mobilis TaxID=483324 RepID=UPI001C955BAA|nr:glycoside hydrolase family 99-like domain-containing protein [Maritalea mobilis]MBY6203256.1 glycoside hydrolase family 99-like domain-containing protein [Maritalea mobilis]